MQQIDRNADTFASARREFLAKCGRLAVVTPPTVTLMLAASQRNFAVAHSGGGNPTPHPRPNNGFGNGGHDGVPGRSQHEDNDR